MPDNVNKPLVIKAVISEIQNKNQPLRIEAKGLESFASPPKLRLKENDREFIPDLVVHYDKHADLYEIEMKDHMDIEKWRQMLLYARKLKGHLFLVVPDFLCQKVKFELEKNTLNAGLICFNTG